MIIQARRWHDGQAIDTPSLDSNAFIDVVCDMVQKADKAALEHNTQLCAIGVAVQGVVDVEGRTILWSPITKLKNIALVDAAKSNLAFRQCWPMIAR